jgi:hypothetical protein
VLREKHVKLSSQAGRPKEAGTKHAVFLHGIQRYVLENGKKLIAGLLSSIATNSALPLYHRLAGWWHAAVWCHG